jgi:hypothetical protein
MLIPTLLELSNNDSDLVKKINHLILLIALWIVSARCSRMSIPFRHGQILQSDSINNGDGRFGIKSMRFTRLSDSEGIMNLEWIR